MHNFRLRFEPQAQCFQIERAHDNDVNVRF